jgi:hypothetical protein
MRYGAGHKNTAKKRVGADALALPDTRCRELAGS